MKYKLAIIGLFIIAGLITLFINALKIFIVVGFISVVAYCVYKLIKYMD
jgi:hypothetical protein